MGRLDWMREHVAFSNDLMVAVKTVIVATRETFASKESVNWIFQPNKSHQQHQQMQTRHQKQWLHLGEQVQSLMTTSTFIIATRMEMIQTVMSFLIYGDMLLMDLQSAWP